MRTPADKTLSLFKRRLTRALRSNNHWHVLDEARRFVKHYEDAGEPFPEDWHDWARAAEDARYSLLLAGAWGTLTDAPKFPVF